MTVFCLNKITKQSKKWAYRLDKIQQGKLKMLFPNQINMKQNAIIFSTQAFILK